MKAVTVTHDLKIGFTELEEPLHKSAGAFVGGWIEIVRPRGLKRPYVLIVNEEFMLLGLPKNEIGYYLYQTHLHGNPSAEERSYWLISTAIMMAITTKSRIGGRIPSA